MKTSKAKTVEELVDEDRERERMDRRRNLRRLLIFFSLGLQVLGWFRLSTGDGVPGAVLIVTGLLLYALVGGLWKALGKDPTAWASGILMGSGAGVFFASLRSPGFQWGADPSFYRAVLSGAVPAPFASPTAYLLAQSVLPLLKSGAWPDLPLVSSIVFGAAVALTSLTAMESAGKEWKSRLFSWAASLAFVATLPVGFYATRASGLVPGLGLILAFLLLHLTKDGPPPRAAFLLTGLLLALHPAWGILGLLILFRRPMDALRRLPEEILSLLLGLTPYLWILFHAGRHLGDWGGTHPFGQLPHAWRNLWDAHWAQEGSLWAICLGWGGSFLALVGLLAVLGPKAKGSSRHLGIALAALAGAILFAAPSSGSPGTLAPFLAAAAVVAWTALFAEAGGAPSPANSTVRVAAWVSVAASLALAALPSQWVQRTLTLAPLRHAENLLSNALGTGRRTILLTEDPFETQAASLVLERTKPPEAPVVVSAPNLSDRWYLSELIHARPEILLATAEGGRERIFIETVRGNLSTWDLEWAVSEIPPALSPQLGFQAAPRVLTLRLQDPKAPLPPEDPTLRYDLSDLQDEAAKIDGGARRALLRYSRGLQAWGVSLTRSGRYLSAVKCFERALSLDPLYAEPKTALERLYNEKSMAEAARYQYEQIVRRLPATLQALEKRLGRAAEGDRPALLAEKAKDNDELADAYHHLGLIYGRLGRFEDSRKALEEGLKVRPDRASTLMELARLFLKVGNRARAQECFKAVLKADPENKEAQAELWKLINRP